ncbi:LD-carboxypeptidase [Litoribacter ruber]|uniref:LD-carboxypeptidase n=1 Tax=Litoribacter ruber TaxID=702568 RepID=A0AAP2CFY9_9BACT|nr:MULTISPECIES: LD-carboxypeptidase [Litoribacter]MBS9522864.1 LD-carboxypeptidase [Litoribacter alkaliphilus]MBT0812372.1 LD-carboxypeptidase [Litoribacter ruber]
MNKRNFLKSLGLSMSLFPILGMQKAIKSTSPVQKLLPKPLQKGDIVGLISPSAATAERIQFQLAKEALEALGFEVKMGENLQNRRGHLAGTDAERANDLNGMFADEQVKAVICIRGGSGAARILPMIDYENIKRNPKPILGYSDITALHNAIYAKTGLITFHGPNGTGSWNSFNVRQFEEVFFNQSLHKFENEQEKGDELIVKNNRIQTITSGEVEGELVGGNLTVLTALAGTGYLPDFHDKILFLEDIGEEPYKVDRMMSTLKLMGALSQIKGFVFGQCTDCSPTGGYGTLTLDDIFDDYIKPLNIPAYRGAMIGHVPKQFIVPIGAKARMNADEGTFQLTEKLFQS